jgi:DNA repair protein RadC
VVFDGLRSGVSLYHPARRRILVTGPNVVFEHLKPMMLKAEKEVFLTLLLNARNQILRVICVSVGSLNASIVHPREVFRPAIRYGAAAIILVHNHPSGECDPSEDDLALTRRLCQVGEMCGIAVLDHVVIGFDSFTSLKQEGHM